MMKFYTSLINNSFNKKVHNYIASRDKLYKVKIETIPKNAKVLMNGEEKYFDVYKSCETINYQVSLEGYQTKEGIIKVLDNDILENVIL